jgi:hypothetical protein
MSKMCFAVLGTNKLSFDGMCSTHTAPMEQTCTPTPQSPTGDCTGDPESLSLSLSLSLCVCVCVCLCLCVCGKRIPGCLEEPKKSACTFNLCKELTPSLSLPMLCFVYTCACVCVCTYLYVYVHMNTNMMGLVFGTWTDSRSIPSWMALSHPR